MTTKKLNEQEALGFSYKLLSLYYEKRDMGSLLQHMEDRTSWIGTGEDELSRNLSEAKLALAAELKEYEGFFSIEDVQLSFISITDQCGIVYGTLNAVPTDDELISNEDIRITAILEQGEENPKLIHFHISHSDITQQRGNYFVKKIDRSDNQTLRAELNMKERQLAEMTQNIPGGTHRCAFDTNLTLLSVSDGFLSMFGYSKEEIDTLFNRQYLNMIYPDDRAKTLKTIREQLKKSDEIEAEYRVLSKYGQPIWVLDKGRLIETSNHDKCFYCLLINNTQRKLQEEQLRLSLERHQVILDQATDIIFEWDLVTDTLDFSPNWYERFHYDAINKNISKSLPLSDNIHSEDKATFSQLIHVIATGTPYAEAEFRICDCMGDFSWSRVRVTTQYGSDGCPIKAIGVIANIDTEIRQRQELIQQAQFDVLTNIYNKSAINRLVQQRMQEKYASNDSLYHVLMIIDVDHFKEVNDRYGHLCGDSVLSDVAIALKGNTQQVDLVGRIGGDEFLVYLANTKNKTEIKDKAIQIMQALGRICPEIGTPPITCSIGIAVCPYSDQDYETLYHNADSALYWRKNLGREGFTFYEPEMEKNAPSHPITAVGNSIVSDETNVIDEWLAQYSFRTLYEAKDIESSINRLLEIIGRSFDVSRAYIFESSTDGKKCSNTFEWCDENVTPQIDILQNINYIDELGNYPKNFNKNGIFYCENIETLHPDLYAILKPQHIQSMLQCAILDEAKFVGYVGFDECRKNREWNERQIAAFKLTADVLSIFLLKLRAKQKYQRMFEKQASTD